MELKLGKYPARWMTLERYAEELEKADEAEARNDWKAAMKLRDAAHRNADNLHLVGRGTSRIQRTNHF
jgi:hypothetical protein